MTTHTPSSDKKFGAVAIIGATNAGKSTLTNAMVGEKVAITSHKVQTTRFQIRGILTHGDAQIVLVDTPGFFQPRRQFDRAMIANAWEALNDVEVVAFLVDASRPLNEKKQKDYIDRINKDAGDLKKILILNKVDQTAKNKLLDMAVRLNQLCDFDATFMISATDGSGVSDVIDYCAKHMPEGDWVYDEDDMTTMPNRLMASEITREKIYARLHQELPYRIAVETESFDPAGNGHGYAISQIIIIEDKKHKPIVLGKQGQTLKTIGKMAREDLMDIFDCPVHLTLYIQHRDHWLDKPEAFAVFDE